MKILLIQPPRRGLSFELGPIEPLGLETIAGCIQNHEIKIIDMRIDTDLKSNLDNFQPDIVGITSVTAEVNVALRVLQSVKNYCKDILTVVGGVHATMVPEDFNKEFVDIIVIGEGEITFQELVEAYRNRTSFAKVAGLALPGKEQLYFTPSRELIKDLNSVPLPNRVLTGEYRQYYSRGSWRQLGALYSTRGCPFHCNFCCCWMVSNATFRIRGVESFIDDLKSIKEPYIFVADDNTILDFEYCERLYQAVKREGIKKKYEFYGRADVIAKRPDLIEKWKSVGLGLVLVGFEEITDSNLKKYNKNCNVKSNEIAINILKQNEVEIIAYFLIDSDFSKEDFNRLSEYIKIMELTHPMFPILTPFPGTELYKERRHEIINDNYELYDFVHCVFPTKLPEKEFYKCYIELIRETYLSREKAVSKKSVFSNQLVEKEIKILEKEYGL